MIWGLIGLFVVVMIVALALTHENMGRALPIAAVTVFVVIGSLALYQNYSMKVSESRIPAKEVELADMQLTDKARGVKILSGRIRNHSSSYTLAEVQIRVSIQDCIKDHCEVINQTQITLEPQIPPGQARDVSESISFPSEVAPRGTPRLQYAVIATRGE